MATWQPDGTGIQDGGDCGGDIQAGNSYSVRFTRRDMPGSLVTITFYPVEYDNCPGEFVVQRQIEWMVCRDPRDPGSTEIWSDVEYDDVSDTVSGTVAGAEREACGKATYALGTADEIKWDGQPEWSRR
jgi:hypothetical protein